MKRILYILALLLSILACREEIDKSNRYTFTGETVADFMLNRSEKYSHFITLLKRAELFGLLSTYGQYTLFLPDNDAVEKYVQEQDSIYWTTKDTNKPVYTGITSPLVEELSDSMANVIARMHLIEGNYHTAEFGEGAIANWNFYDRALVISYKVVDERFYIMINNNSAILDGDNQVENGIIHIINKPINSQPSYLAGQIEKYDFFRLFSTAISETKFGDKISQEIDHSYVLDENNVYYQYNPNLLPKKKYIKYTAFIEPDEVFHKQGIYTLDDLKAFAEKWYGTEDRDNPRSPKNALNKFVAYHFIDGEVPYNRIVPSPSGSRNFNLIYIPGNDLYNYFTTLQGTLMKALKPLSTTEGLNIYLNYSKRTFPYNTEMYNHINVRVIELTEFTKMNEQYAEFVPNTTNGIIHPIDKILIYNEDEMVGNILNERMRFDIATMLPELSSNNLWQNHLSVSMIPDGYCKGMKKYGIADSWGYQRGSGYNCDEVRFSNQYDWSIKLPPVPPRTYEIRFSIIMFKGDDYKGPEDTFFQLYFDDKICGLPINQDIPITDERIGWEEDYMTLDNGAENDKLLRNKGWMKAPDVYNSGWYQAKYMPARNSSDMRKIATIQYLAEGEHWLRFRNLVEHETLPGTTGTTYLILDYIEIVPLHIISDPTKPEDRH